MSEAPPLQRFVEAQETSYSQALAEVKNGQKRSHWMWYIFPQIQGLGFSATSRYYALADLAAAAAFLTHPLLGPRLVQISEALLALPGHNATSVLGSPDDLKLRSSMTLFAAVPGAPPVFELVLAKFFQGVPDPQTRRLLNQTS